MKMAKKLLAVALAGVLALSVLTGCDGSSKKVSTQTLADSLNQMGVKVEYKSADKLNDVAKDTLKAIQTIIDSADNKALAADDTNKVTWVNAVDAKDGKVIKNMGFSFREGIIINVNDTVKKTLKIDENGANADKQVQVALVSTDNAKKDSSMQAFRVKEALVTAYREELTDREYSGQTGSIGSAVTDDGNYVLVVIVTEKKTAQQPTT